MPISRRIGLPSKENGLDIEGMTLLSHSVLLGLRGPVIDSHAVIVSLLRTAARPADEGAPKLHFFDLRGLGIGDLCRDGNSVLILAGPVTGADGPFRLYRWQPRRSAALEPVDLNHEWQLGHEHPEGVCPLSINGKPGLLVVYDSPDPRRLSRSKVSADWFEAPAAQP